MCVSCIHVQICVCVHTQWRFCPEVLRIPARVCVSVCTRTNMCVCKYEYSVAVLPRYIAGICTCVRVDIYTFKYMCVYTWVYGNGFASIYCGYLHMCVCQYVHVRICVCLHVRIRGLKDTCLSVCVNKHLWYMYVHACESGCVSAWWYTRIYRDTDICIHLCAHICIHVDVQGNGYMYTLMCAYMYTCWCIYVYIYVCIFLYVFTCICIYSCIHAHITQFCACPGSPSTY